MGICQYLDHLAAVAVHSLGGREGRVADFAAMVEKAETLPGAAAWAQRSRDRLAALEKRYVREGDAADWARIDSALARLGVEIPAGRR